MMRLPTQKAQKPWFVRALIAPPTAIALLLFGMVFWGSLKAVLDIKKRETRWTKHVVLGLLPFIFSFYSLIEGTVLSKLVPVNLTIATTLGAIVYLGFHTLRIAANPLSFLDRFLIPLLESKNTLIPKIVKETLLSKHAVKSEKTDFIETITATTVQVVLFSKAALKLFSSPRIPLAIFLTYYSVALSTTIALFAVLLKATTTGIQPHSFSDYVLASLLRFTAQSDLGLVLDGLKVNQWIMALESSATFFYLVIAVMAFSAIASHSSVELREKLKILYDREMDAFQKSQMDLIKSTIEQRITERGATNSDQPSKQQTEAKI